MGISRGPVREAFRALEQAGLVATAKNRGVFVRQVSREEANEIYEVRAALEREIGALAAKRAKREHLERLRAIVKRMQAAGRKRDPDAYFPLNIEFHEVLAEAAGNRALAAHYRRVVNELNLYRREAITRNVDVIPVSTRGARRDRRGRDQGRRGARRAPALRARDQQPLAAPSKGQRGSMTSSMNKPAVTVNGTQYRWPDRPLVVVCIDGGDPAYFRRFLAEGAIPNIARFIQQGFSAVADGTMPSFTCPNNMSIITGTPASKHGISGNYYLDTDDRQADRDDRPGAAARRHDPVALRRRRRQGDLDHGEGQAAQAARQEPRRLEGQHQLLLRVRFKSKFERKRHRERARAHRHGAARHVLDGAVALRARGRHQAAGEPAPAT